MQALVFASKAGGFNLTDAHLTDEVPTPWRGRSLWVGDLPTSRLVETEVEIADQVSKVAQRCSFSSIFTLAVTFLYKIHKTATDADRQAVHRGAVSLQVNLFSARWQVDKV